MKKKKNEVIVLTDEEVQSGQDRVSWAEGLISQLPLDHDGRNSWLLAYGKSEESDKLREKFRFIESTQASETIKR